MAAGESWCAAKSKCVRSWEEPCDAPKPPTPPIGPQKDANGCLVAAGYSWCAAKSKCLRSWEEPCDAPKPPTPAAKAAAEKPRVDCVGAWSDYDNACTAGGNPQQCRTYHWRVWPSTWPWDPNPAKQCPYENGHRECRDCTKQSYRCQDAYRFSTVGNVPFKKIKSLGPRNQPSGAHCQSVVNHYVHKYAHNHIQALAGGGSSKYGPPQGGPKGAIFASPHSVRGTDIGEIVFPSGVDQPNGDVSRVFVNGVYYYARLGCTANVVRCGNGEISGSGSCSVHLTSVQPFCVKQKVFTPWPKN